MLCGRLVVLAILASLLATPRARANFGSLPGGWNGEPTGLEEIRVTREILTVDLRGCDGSATAGRSDVEQQPVGDIRALYRLENRGPEREVQLVFAAGVDIEAGTARVWLNDQPVEIDFTPRPDIRWRVPVLTPGFREGKTHSFGNACPQGNFAVRLRIPSGVSTLNAEFRNLIGNDRSSLPVCTWQFVYLLAPIRDWSALERLEIKVLVPPGWQVASNLRLHRDGDVLTGVFDSIPDDALTLSIRMPPEQFQAGIDRAARLTWTGAALSVLLLLAGVWRGGRLNRSGGERIVLVFASGFLLGAVVWIAAYFLLVFPVEMPEVPQLQRGASGSGIRLIDFVWLFAAVGASLGIGAGMLLTAESRRQVPAERCDRVVNCSSGGS